MGDAMTSATRSLVLVLCLVTSSVLLSSSAHAEPPVAPTEASSTREPVRIHSTTRVRMQEAATAIEGVPLQALRKMTVEEHAALLAIARDEGQTLYARARAIGLVGARPNAAAEALWEEARKWPERELRIQAAWAQGLARLRSEAALPFVESLLADEEAHLREVGVQLLFRLDTDGAVARARAHLEGERDVVVRRLIERRLKERRARRE